MVMVDTGQELADIRQTVRTQFTPSEYELEWSPEDHIGIFNHKDPQARERAGSYFKELRDKVMGFERGLLQGVDSFPKSPENVRPKDRTIIRTKQEQKHIHEFGYLVEAITTVLLDLKTDAEWKNLLRMYDRNSLGHKIVRDRFTNEVRVTKYEPQGRIPGQLQIIPRAYQFDRPALVEQRVTDHVKNQTLVFEFFPLRYSRYGKHSELDGLDPEEARQTLLERKRDGRFYEDIDVVVAAGKQSLVEPYIGVRLEGENGQVFAAVRGHVVKKESGDQALVLPLHFLDMSMALPLPKQNGKQVLVEQLTSDFMGLSTKSVLKQKEAHYMPLSRAA